MRFSELEHEESHVINDKNASRAPLFKRGEVKENGHAPKGGAQRGGFPCERGGRLHPKRTTKKVTVAIGMGVWGTARLGSPSQKGSSLVAAPFLKITVRLLRSVLL